MSIRFSVNEFIAVGKLAWGVYKSCRDAPESFNNISIEVLSLHAVLKEVEEILSEEALPPAKQNNLALITQGCEAVLVELQALVVKYESLGSASKRTWDRMRWGAHDIAGLRSRLTSNTMLLTAFMSTSQLIVERKLNKLIQEFQDGKQEGSVMSALTIESLAADEEQTWRAIRKELEEIGISIAAFDANKAFILDWFQSAIKNGLFEERSVANTDSEHFDTSSMSPAGDLNNSSKTLSTTTDPRTPTSGDTPYPGDSTFTITSTPAGNDATAAAGLLKFQQTKQPIKKSKNRMSQRFSELFIEPILRLRLPENEYWEACRLGELDEAAKYLSKGVSIDVKKGDRGWTPLMRAALSGDMDTARWLLLRGADPNTRDNELMTALHEVLMRTNDLRMFHLLLAFKADINAQNAATLYWYTTLYAAAKKGNIVAVELLVGKGAAIELGNVDQFTPLHAAALSGKTQTVEFLLRHGANANTSSLAHRNSIFKRTPLIDALKKGHDEVAVLLINYNADIDRLVDNDENTMLHIAAKGKCWEAAQLLIKKGLDPKKLNTDKNTPIQIWDRLKGPLS